MKRFFTMIVASCAFFAVLAQHPMVTISHNGELSFFTNLTALESAYSAAENGDTIFLSQGDFVVNGGTFTIKKSLSIIGNGYGSHILGDITVGIPNDIDMYVDGPLFDGVRLDKLEFSSSNNLATQEIRRCWIRTLKNGAYAAKNVTYDKCYIEDAAFGGEGTVLVINSKVTGTNNGSNDLIRNISAINCNISEAYYYPLTMISCIFKKKTSDGQPTVSGSSVSIINSLLDFRPTSTSVYQHECYYIENPTESILDDKMNCTLNLTELGYIGQDGTVVGIQGGEYPFSENPSVPSVDTDNSTVEYDSSANKLKVKISVKAD